MRVTGMAAPRKVGAGRQQIVTLACAAACAAVVAAVPVAVPPHQQFQHVSACQPRHIYLDLGVNWGNILRLYGTIGDAAGGPLLKASSSWHVYGVEASPLIQPFVEELAIGSMASPSMSRSPAFRAAGQRVTEKPMLSPTVQTKPPP